MKLESSTPFKGKVQQYILTGCTPEQAKQSADNILTEAGYKLKKDDWQQSEYTKGNRVLRILFGAFVKYNKILVSLSGSSDKVTMTVSNQSSGFSGGMIGMAQVNKEYKRVIAAFDEKLGTALY
jgi:hypothetical protein